MDRSERSELSAEGVPDLDAEQGQYFLDVEQHMALTRKDEELVRCLLCLVAPDPVPSELLPLLGAPCISKRVRNHC